MSCKATPFRFLGYCSHHGIAIFLAVFLAHALSASAGLATDPPAYLPVWIAGSDTGNALGIYGTKGQAAAANLPGGREWTTVWTDADGNPMVFGGYGWGKYRYGSQYLNALGPLNDVWRYDAANDAWTWVQGENFTWGTGTVDVDTSLPVRPSGRYGMVHWREASGDELFFGGWGFDGDCCYDFLAETWRWDSVANAWVFLRLTEKTGVYGERGVASDDNHPGARARAASWTAADGTFWLFGGVGYATDDTETGTLNDLWKYDPASGQWTWMHGTNSLEAAGVYGEKGVPAADNTPGGRVGAAHWVDVSGNLWLFGGEECALPPLDYNRCLTVRGDLWKYDPTANTWTWMAGSDETGQNGVYGEQGLPAPGNTPGARTDAAFWTDAAGNLWLFGGVAQALADDGTFTSDTLPFADLWQYDVALGLWTWMQGSRDLGEESVHGERGVGALTNRIGGREGAVAVAAQAGDVWLFGGAVSPNTMNYETFGDLWRLEPSLAPPKLGATGIAQTAFTLYWAFGPGNDGYKVTVARDAAFTDILPNYDDLPVSGNTLRVTGLGAATRYYARAKAVRGSEESAVSDVCETRTLAGGIAAINQLLLLDAAP